MRTREDINEHFRCQCSSPEHSLDFVYIRNVGEPEVSAYVFLNAYRGILGRAWEALKYVLGYTSRYGHFDSFILRPEDVPRFQELLGVYAEDHGAWSRKQEQERKYDGK
jgi:hypothetical protein